MSGINDVGSNQEALQQYSSDNLKKESSNELGQNEFMELLVAQLNNQNPLEPQENTEFIAQLAQFTTVESLENLNTTATDMQSDLRSSQALQASAMVGRSVIVPDQEYGFLQPNDLIAGYAELPATTSNLKLEIKSSGGATLETIPLGSHSQGPVTLRWDGANLEVDGEIFDLSKIPLNRTEPLRDEDGEPILDTNGNPIRAPYPAGEYQFKLTASIEGKTESLDTAMSGRVDSVTIGANSSAILNLAGGTKASINDVKQILE